MKEVTVFCDGSSIGNPGPGGWGSVVADGARAKELGGYDAHTTNNRMELAAAIEAIKILKAPTKVTVNTDSRYVINGITKWVHGWSKNGWLTKEKKDVQNKDLWQELQKVSEKHTIAWEHVRGHSGIALNERVDVIANGFARKERVDLYEGSLAKYQEFLKTMPKPRAVASSSSRKGKAYSYVSCVDGKVMTHDVWDDCQKRVRGRNAKYKKVFSREEERELKAAWAT